MKTYCIRDGYIHATSIRHFDDRVNEDRWQDEVYKIAKRMLTERDLKSVLDIGTGSGFKLMKYFKDYKTTGMELEPCLSFLKDKYPDRVWLHSDFNTPQVYGDHDLIICSDVIEHLEDPDDLMNFLSSLNWKILVLSTPDREYLGQLNSEREKGPPWNPCHYREWTKDELIEYLSKHMNVIESTHAGSRVCHTVIASK